MQASSQSKVCVVQDGARRHYLVPYAMQQAGLLDSVFADWYVKERSIAARLARMVQRIRPAIGRKMLERRRAGLDESRVITNAPLALRNRLGRRRFDAVEEYYRWVSERHADWILSRGFGNATALYGFIRNVHPRVLREANQQGLITVGDQIIAPARVEREEQQKQQQRFPGWEAETGQESWDIVEAFEAESWAECDRIVCGSDYVKEGLIRLGVAGERIEVIQYAPVPEAPPPPRVRKEGGPLVVGFVGTVSLRKGAPYFLEVARRFKPSEVRFVMVGPVALNPEIVASQKGRVELVGPVPRSEVKRWLAEFDVFLFPSTCEGSAGATLEAMQAGVPVVTSPNSGSIVEDGVSGFVRPYDDIDGLASAIETIISDPDREREIVTASANHIGALDLNNYCQRLRELVADQVSARRCPPLKM